MMESEITAPRPGPPAIELPSRTGPRSRPTAIPAPGAGGRASYLLHLLQQPPRWDNFDTLMGRATDRRVDQFMVTVEGLTMGSWVDPSGAQVNHHERRVTRPAARPSRACDELSDAQLTRIGVLSAALLTQAVGLSLYDALSALALAAGSEERDFRAALATAPRQAGEVLAAMKRATYCGVERGFGVE
jgi:hypothetical protein